MAYKIVPPTVYVCFLPILAAGKLPKQPRLPHLACTIHNQRLSCLMIFPFYKYLIYCSFHNYHTFLSTKKTILQHFSALISDASIQKFAVPNVCFLFKKVARCYSKSTAVVLNHNRNFRTFARVLPLMRLFDTFMFLGWHTCLDYHCHGVDHVLPYHVRGGIEVGL